MHHQVCAPYLSVGIYNFFCTNHFVIRKRVTSVTAALICEVIALLKKIFCVSDSRLEGWLSIPNKQNIKRHGWRRQYVVVSSRKIIFYNSENDKQNSDPILILDLT